MKFSSSSLEDTKNIAKMFCENIYPFSNILIYWEMWAWKTSFVSFLLSHIWVKQKVKSPSYSLSHNYKADFSEIWHYDLYRLNNTKKLYEIDEHFFSEDLVICEWAERLSIKPNNRIEIYIKNTNDLSSTQRKFEFKFYWSSLSEEKIKDLFGKYNTPKHILKHINSVTEIADTVANSLIKKWILIDKDLVHTWAMLHDILRYIDFKWWLIREKIPYDCSDEDFDFWCKISNDFKWIHHACAAWNILDKMWYKEIWNVIKAHRSGQIFKWFNTIEEKIVYYADKRVLHDKKVSLDERLADAKIRYSHEWDSSHWKKLSVALFKLEKELVA